MQTNPRNHNINKHGSIVIQYMHEQNSVHMIGDPQLQKNIESIYSEIRNMQLYILTNCSMIGDPKSIQSKLIIKGCRAAALMISNLSAKGINHHGAS